MQGAVHEAMMSLAAQFVTDGLDNEIRHESAARIQAVWRGRAIRQDSAFLVAPKYVRRVLLLCRGRMSGRQHAKVR
ncbi:unnamed protein product [Polarella glacialis]|uniref:Uncharacterized protein n=1 Tax=Polarella glacialis TaxID=89957 RepID=A0A813JX36_POLGL|nr:unnamed protein product [Polarella glacialis]